MPYIHSVDNTVFDTTVEDFAVMTRFTIAAAGEASSGRPTISSHHFCIWSERENNPDANVRQRRLSAPNNAAFANAQYHALKLDAGGNRTLEMTDCQLRARVKSQSSAERTSLCLWHTTRLGLDGWDGNQPHIGIRRDVIQSFKFNKKNLGVPYHIYGEEDGAGHTTRLGICRPLVSTNNSFSSVLDYAVAYRAGMPELVVESEGQFTTLFQENAGQPTGPVEGFVLILAGAFAPTSYKSFEYQWWNTLLTGGGAPGASSDPDAGRLFSYARREKQARLKLSPAEQPNALGTAAPVEILFLTGVQNAAVPVILA